MYRSSHSLPHPRIALFAAKRSPWASCRKMLLEVSSSRWSYPGTSLPPDSDAWPHQETLYPRTALVLLRPMRKGFCSRASNHINTICLIYAGSLHGKPVHSGPYGNINIPRIPRPHPRRLVPS